MGILLIALFALVWTAACAHDRYKEDKELEKELKRIARRKDNERIN